MKTFTRTLAAAVTLAAFAAVAQAQGAPNLVGQWELNAAKSDFGAMPAPSKATLNVTQSTATLLKFSQVIGTPEGERTMNVDIPIIGKDTTYNGTDGQPVTTNAKWDNGALVSNAKFSRMGADITQASKFTLSADGKTLQLDQSFTSPMGAMNMKLVFDKK